MYINRKIEEDLKNILKKGKSILLLGPRQTGKTSLIESTIKFDKEISFLLTKNRLKYERNPEILVQELRALKGKSSITPLVFIDEIQKIPALMDEIQFAIDKKIAKFILTGSSARKLRKQHETMNMLPGRLITFKLDPFIYEEYPKNNLNNLLYYGSLPEISLSSDKNYKETLLESYIEGYLEEEIRAEALVRDIGTFNRFLEFAGIESGKLLSFSSIANELGVAHTTIQSHFQILVDTLIAEKVEPITKSSTRKRLVRSSRYLIFDMGVRRLCAREGIAQNKEYEGYLFEHFVGLELIRLGRLKSNRIKIKFWKDLNGPEIDWVVDFGPELVPIEVKLSKNIAKSDTKHIELFIKEYPKAKKGFIICDIEEDRDISSKVKAISWKNIKSIY